LGIQVIVWVFLVRGYIESFVSGKAGHNRFRIVVRTLMAINRNYEGSDRLRFVYGSDRGPSVVPNNGFQGTAGAVR
jgi:hypothetical protein